MTASASRIEEAQVRIARLAQGLACALGPREAVSLLLSAGAVLAEHALGREAAVAWLRELANEIEKAPIERATVN